MSQIIETPSPAFDRELLQQLLDRHTPLQQMWLSGYLYGIAQQGQPTSLNLQEPAVQAVVPTVPKISVLYGSQTGNSKKVAAQLLARLHAGGYEASLSDLNEYEPRHFSTEKLLLLVVSTQGDGEPPAAAEECYKWLMGPRAPRLESLRFAVCGLGDSTYDKFCQTGKDLDARLEALGGKRLTERADCDVDYAEQAEAWVERVLAQLSQTAMPQHTATQVNGKTPAPTRLQESFDRKRPFLAPVLEKIQLNGRGSTKETWHLALSTEGSGLEYAPGDALGVYPENPPGLVQEVLYAAMLNGDKLLEFNGKEDKFRNILLRNVELTVLHRKLIESYAAWTDNARLKQLLQDESALKTFMRGRNLADLLREYPAALSEVTLLGFLRSMPPRLYSISSCPETFPGEVHLTVAALRYTREGRLHLGAASTFLADRLLLDEQAPVFIERNEYFKLPADDSTDIIMVGPGTGVAPFRAFVQARAQRGANGKNWLFFGNPHFDTDFLYQTEWLQHLKRGTLDRLDVAFSRDQADKIYVQDRLLERGKLIYERLENGASFYVCGNREGMAESVKQALLQLIERASGKDAAYAQEYFSQLKKQRRFLEDVY